MITCEEVNKTNIIWYKICALRSTCNDANRQVIKMNDDESFSIKELENFRVSLYFKQYSTSQIN